MDPLQVLHINLHLPFKLWLYQFLDCFMAWQCILIVFLCFYPFVGTPSNHRLNLWIYLWTFITNLEFEDRATFCIKISISKAPIYNFVDKILLCLKSSIIQSFSLFIRESYNNHRVDKWIYNIINWIQKIKKLYIILMTTQDCVTHIFSLEFPILWEIGGENVWVSC